MNKNYAPKYYTTDGPAMIVVNIIKGSLYKLYDTAIKERDAYKAKVKEASHGT